MANFRLLEPGNWQLYTGDEFFTPSLTAVDPQIPVLPLESPAGGPAAGFFSLLLMELGGAGLSAAAAASSLLLPPSRRPLLALRHF